MEYFKNIEIKNKRVLVRCDFNVTIKDGNIIDDTKIIKSLDTIKYLIENNNKLIILSHLGKVKSESDKIKNTLYPVYLKLKELLNTTIYFSKSTRGKELEEMISNLKEKEIVLIENTRHEDYIEKKESTCDDNLSRYWASLGNVFINDAFGTSHRKHASNYGITKYLPSYYGSLIKEEKTKLDELIHNPKKPFLVIMGGAKVEDKIKLISELLPLCDKLIVGGGIANTFMYAKKYNVGSSLLNLDNIDEIKKLILKYENKIIIPKDLYVSNNDEKIYRNIEEVEKDDIIYDIGEKTLEEYNKVIQNSETIFINGTVGLYEDKRFENGTKNLFKLLERSGKKVFVGGGDAVSATNKLGFTNAFYYKSTGGGATLEYIINKKMPALED